MYSTGKPHFKDHVLFCCLKTHTGAHFFCCRIHQTQTNAHAGTVLKTGVAVIPFKQARLVRVIFFRHTVADLKTRQRVLCVMHTDLDFSAGGILDRIAHQILDDECQEMRRCAKCHALLQVQHKTLGLTVFL